MFTILFVFVFSLKLECRRINFARTLIVCVHAQSFQSSLTLYDPTDGSPPGSSVPGILHARILEWVPMSSCRGSSQPRDQTLILYISCIRRQVLYH